MTGLDQETRSLIGQTLGRFVRDHADVHRRRARLAETAIDERRHWTLMADLGILALPFAEPLGGIGGSAVDIAEAASRLGEGLILEPFVEGVAIASAVLAVGGASAAVHEAAVHEAAVAAAIDGSVLSMLVGGRSADCDRLTAEQRDGGYRLSGRLRVVPQADVADMWLVAARRTDGTPVILRVPAGKAGASVAPYRLMDGRGAADVTFVDALITDDALWLDGPAAAAALQAATLRAVSAYAADAVGVMECLLRDTGAYLMTRKQFGAAIGSFQALQHRYADMHMAWLEARAITRALAAGIDGEAVDESRRLAAMTASVVERAAAQIGHEAIQMHGGMGVTEELAVSHLNARLVVLTRLIRCWLPRTAYLGDDHDA